MQPVDKKNSQANDELQAQADTLSDGKGDDSSTTDQTQTTVVGAGDLPAKVTYGLKIINTAGDEQKRLDMSEKSKLMIDLEGDPIHLNWEGLSSQFDLSTGKWGVTDRSETIELSFRTTNFLTQGWAAISRNTLTYLDTKSEAMEVFQLPVVLGENDFSVAIPGYLTFFFEKNAYIFHYDGAKADLKQYPLQEKPFVAIGRCDSSCLLWVWDGVNYFYLENSGKRLLKIEIPLMTGATAPLLTMTATMKVNGVSGELNDFYALDTSFNLYKIGQKLVAEKSATWETVSKISKESCVPCHRDDGFDKKEVWTGLKAEVVRRLDPTTKTEVFAMPTWETKYGKEFSTENRQLILSWIGSEAATASGGFGTANDPVDVPLTGRLKFLTDNHCVGCHVAAKTEGFWRARKNDVMRRVNSKNMPKDQDMSDALRNEFNALIGGL